MKQIIKRAARGVGLEIHRVVADRPLSWTIPAAEPMRPESTAQDWRTPVLRLLNRHYRPPQLQMWAGTNLARIPYVTSFLDVRGARVLELGPHEGFFSVLLDKLGAAEVVAVEGRLENLDKCRQVKTLFKLDQTIVVRHDIEALAAGDEEPSFMGSFDLVFSLGVLYHLRDPVRALRWMADQADLLFLGTAYVERADNRWYPDRLFVDHEYESAGERFTGKRFVESPQSPLGGLSDYSIWLDEESLLRGLRAAGFTTISVIGKELMAEFPHITIRLSVG